MADANDLKTPQAASQGIRVNMSAEEAKSEARTDLPAGKFHLKITDMELKFTSQQAKNAGKPYFNFEFTIQDGQYEGRKDWTNAMCFSPALYTISQILKALGRQINPTGGEVVIPDAREFYVGKDLWGVRRMNKKNKNADGETEPRIELMGFMKYEGGASEASATTAKAGAAKQSVLP